MFVHNEEIALEAASEGITRKVLAHSDNMMSVEVHFEEGAVAAMHNHPHEQLTYVLSGEFEFTIGDETQVVKVGDTMYKEPNIMHGCRCLKAGVLLDTFTPTRQDFLQK